MAWHRPDVLTSGVDVLAYLCGQNADTSNMPNYCDSIQSYDNRRFSFCQCDTIFLIVFLGNYHKFELLTFARSCGKILKVWWDILYDSCWKSVKIHEFGVLLFGTQCRRLTLSLRMCISISRFSAIKLIQLALSCTL